MSDDTTSSEETMSAEEPETDEPEFDTTKDEFQALFKRCGAAKEKLLQMANRMSQSNTDAADVLRQVAGNVLQLLEDTVAACGGALDAIETQLEEGAGEGGEEGIGEEDAVVLTKTFLANEKLVDDCLLSATDDAKPVLHGLKAMNEESRERVLELSGLEAEELQKLIEEEEQSEEQSEEPAAPPPSEVN